MSITNHPQPFRFTPENARINAAKSWEARRERKAKLEAEAAKGRQSTPQSERLALQIERVEHIMEKTTDADTLVKLTAAHTRMFKTWQVLTETPNPGSWRGKRRPRPVMPIAAFVDAPASQEATPQTAALDPPADAAATAAPLSSIEQHDQAREQARQKWLAQGAMASPNRIEQPRLTPELAPDSVPPLSAQPPPVPVVFQPPKPGPKKPELEPPPVEQKTRQSGPKILLPQDLGPMLFGAQNLQSIKSTVKPK